MNTEQQVRALDERTVLLILSHLTQQMRPSAPTGRTVGSQDEARRAIAAFLEASGRPGAVDPASVIPAGHTTDESARMMLLALLDDPESGPLARQLLANPPEDTQMSTELAIASAIILGALVTWLQTRVKLKINRKGGQTQFEFELSKEPTAAPTVARLAQAVASVVVQP